MKAFLRRPALILFTFAFLGALTSYGQGKGKDCGESCFTSEMLSVNELDTGCLEYTFRVNADGDCAHALSHFSVEVPCGNVSDLSNSMGWKIEYGLDPTSGIDGFKIDDIQGFGESQDSFEVTFTVCPEDDCSSTDLACWSPRVAYKAATCVYYEELTVQCRKLDAAISATDVTCAGTADGSVTVEIIEGAEPFTFIWSHDESLDSPVATGLSGGDQAVAGDSPRSGGTRGGASDRRLTESRPGPTLTPPVTPT